ncbi:hypothetical protein [Eisenibacter elegans]|jgi:hypothetical protein|uniref:hypothetical protein n=1 Tax=Eisenibacter elegans TaxID=997 RepID=UPI0003FDEFC9|nr:hypothetical protein [Eisenibacter elegans]
MKKIEYKVIPKPFAPDDPAFYQEEQETIEREEASGWQLTERKHRPHKEEVIFVFQREIPPTSQE